jgi:DNA mismatch endonuclease (patch repair protein)
MDGADRFTPAQRSAVMRAVKSRDTTPERLVRRAAFALGARFRLHGGDLPGRPDLVFRARRKAVFVHGCFWHGHACRRGARAPKANAAYWQAKIARNRARDAAVLDALRDRGWSALVVWECETRDAAALSRTLEAFLFPERGNDVRR